MPVVENIPLIHRLHTKYNVKVYEITQIQTCTGLYKFTNTQIQVNMYETKKEQGKQLASIAG